MGDVIGVPAMCNKRVEACEILQLLKRRVAEGGKQLRYSKDADTIGCVSTDRKCNPIGAFQEDPSTLSPPYITAPNSAWGTLQSTSVFLTWHVKQENSGRAQSCVQSPHHHGSNACQTTAPGLLPPVTSCSVHPGWDDNLWVFFCKAFLHHWEEIRNYVWNNEKH